MSDGLSATLFETKLYQSLAGEPVGFYGRVVASRILIERLLKSTEGCEPIKPRGCPRLALKKVVAV